MLQYLTLFRSFIQTHRHRIFMALAKFTFFGPMTAMLVLTRGNIMGAGGGVGFLMLLPTFLFWTSFIATPPKYQARIWLENFYGAGLIGILILMAANTALMKSQSASGNADAGVNFLILNGIIYLVGTVYSVIGVVIVWLKRMSEKQFGT
ncbi:MAG: hypothetical protein JNL01_12610 [Bdellovibrionales bacterium]|nr:hypothetical protein [Bdellovibrionales bacterium]